MQLCHSLCQFFDEYVTQHIPSIHGLVCVGSVAYLEMDDITNADLDLLVVDSIQIDTLQILYDVLRGTETNAKLNQMYGGVTHIKLVRARVSILKMTIYDSNTSKNWDLDLSVVIAAKKDPDSAFRLYDTREIMLHVSDTGQGRQYISLCFTEFVKRALNDNQLFTKPLILMLRRWAQQRQIYGTISGFPGGSAWVVMLWAFCEALAPEDVDIAIPHNSILRLMFSFFLHWPWPLPVTRMNCISVYNNNKENFEWHLLPTGVTKHCCGEVIVPLPDEVHPNADHISSPMNMTHTVGVIQHATMLWELERGTAYNINLMQHLICDERLHHSAFYIVLVRQHGSDEQWEAHIQSLCVSRFIDQLYHIGVISRPCILPSGDIRAILTDGEEISCLKTSLMCWIDVTSGAQDIINAQDTIQRVCNAIEATYPDHPESCIVVEISHQTPFLTSNNVRHV